MSNGNRGAGSQALENEGGEADSGNTRPAADSAENDSQEGSALVLVEQPPSPNESVVAEPQAQTQQANPYQYRDLVAQEEMADAGFWMMVAAFLTFVVTSIGTFLIWRQVKLTREAVKDTGEATDAMLVANEIARNALDADTRPWLIIQSVQPTNKFVRAWEDKFIFKFNIVVRNYGKTPAMSVSVGGAMFVPSYDGSVTRWSMKRGNLVAPGKIGEIEQEFVVPFRELEGRDPVRLELSLLINYKRFDGTEEFEFREIWDVAGRFVPSGPQAIDWNAAKGDGNPQQYAAKRSVTQKVT